MGKIIKNGIEYGGSSNEAININYDNTSSELNANTVQGAIDTIQGTIDEITDTMNVAHYYNHESDIAWTSNTSVVKNGADYSGINIKNGFVSVQVNFFTAASLSSGTEYTAYTISDELKALTGTTQVTGFGGAGNTLIKIVFDTWETAHTLKVTPRGSNVAANTQLQGNLLFPIT